MTTEIVLLPIDGIRITGGTQPRVETNEAVVAEYAEVIRFGGELPPVIVFDDGAELWLADGFHRFHAHRAAGAMEINCDIRLGTKRDAILYSVGANAAHGLRRSNEDKRKAVMTLLNDPEWMTWSNEAIARTCNVSPHTVADAKRSISANTEIPAVRTVERNGKIYEQNTANIGKAKPASPTLSNVAMIAESEPMAAPDETSELREQLAEISAHAKETLSDNEMMGRVFDADDRIKAAMDEAKRQKAIAESAERQFNAQQGKLVALAKQVTYWQRRAEKAEKELARAAA